MLSDKETEALRQWYGQEKTASRLRVCVEKEEWEQLEEYLQMISLMPLSRHSELPEYMKNEQGAPLFPTNLNPKNDLEKWQDAIEVGWSVVKEQTGLSRDEIHLRLAKEQEEDWARFQKSAEERRQRGGGSGKA